MNKKWLPGFIISILSLCLTSACSKKSVDLTIHQAATRADLLAMLSEYENKNSGAWYHTRDTTFAEAMTATNDSSNDHSTTNVQVEGVDEGDIIKVDNEYIYTLTSHGLTITGVQTGDLDIVYQQAFENYVPQEMFLSSNKLIIIGGIYDYFTYTGDIGDSAIEPGICLYRWFAYARTNIRIYNLDNHSNPTLEKEVTIDGNYNTSRIIDGTLYFFSDYYFNAMNEDEFIPKMKDSSIDNGQAYELSVSDIYYYNQYLDYNFFLIGKLDLNNLLEASSVKGYLGISGSLYISLDNAYVAGYDNAYSYVDYLGSSSYTYLTYTRISKISLETLLLVASARVSGNIKDRYSLDEYEGYLRIATTTSDWQNYQSNVYSNVFVLDTQLHKVGQISDIAEGERLYSVRFNQTEGVLVTFRQVDPLFKLDLSDVHHPTISEGLKEDGVSMYLHYIEGTDYVIGLGYDTEVTSSGATIWKGIKVSLYDHSGAEAVNISTVVLSGAWSYAEALYNPKAILYDASRHIFAFAAEEWSQTNTYSYQQTHQGLYVFTYDDNDLSDYEYLTNFETGIVYENWYHYYDNYYSYVSRGARIGDYIYTIGEKYITSYALSDYQLVERIQIGTFTNFVDLYLVD